jgi:hypothetical protein
MGMKVLEVLDINTKDQIVMKVLEVPDINISLVVLKKKTQYQRLGWYVESSTPPEQPTLLPD